MDTFGAMVARRRKRLDLTQAALAQTVGCSLSAIRKIESDLRRPSRQIAELLFQALALPDAERARFLKAARGEGHFPSLGDADSPSVQAGFAPPALPVPSSPLVGRTAELAMLQRLLADPYCRLITLLAPGGMGKTRLALEVAGVEQTAFAGQVYFVSLAALEASEALLPAIAAALGVSFNSNAELHARLRDFLRPKRVLLVLDNFEPLIEAAPVLNDLLQSAPNLKLLVTSRERLRLQGEWVVELVGLEAPPPGEVAAPETYAALRLFEARARQLRPNLIFTPAERAAAAHICASVSGMPLAIELAAAWTETLSCVEIAAEMTRSLDFLTSSLRDIAERHRSLRTVFEHAWARLSPQEQDALSQLSVFRGGFCRAAAQAVAGADANLLACLVSKSLVRHTEQGRFALHEVIRQYAQEKLHSTAELHARFSAYYLQQLAASRAALFGADDVASAQSFSAEASNLALAWQLGLEQGDFAALNAALESLWMICDIHGWLAAGMNHTAALIDALRRLPVSSSQQTHLGRALAFHGMLAFRAGDYPAAQRVLDEAIELLRQANVAQSLPPALIFGGVVLALMGEFDRARTRMDEGAALAAAFQQHWFLALARFDQGFIAGQQGDLEQAYTDMQAGLSIWRELGNTRFTAFALNFYSPIVMQLRRVDEARACLTESLQLASQLRDRWGMGTAYGRLGLLALACNDLLAAEQLLEESLALFTELGARWDIAWAMTGQGKVCAAAGRMPEAEHILRQALHLAYTAQALPQALEASIELAACWLPAAATRPLAIDLLAAARACPSLTAPARQRADALLATCPDSPATVDWEMLVRAIVAEQDAGLSSVAKGN